MKSILKILLLFISAGSIFCQKVNEGIDSIATDEILVTANRISMSNELAPNKIQLIESNLINSLNGIRLSDVLSFSDNSFVKDYGYNSGLKTISLNATQSEQTLILIDGVKLNGRDNAQYDIGLLQLDDAYRVEISNGGSSSLFGSEAIGGVINIITKREGLKPIGFELKGAIGSYGLKRIYLNSAGKLVRKKDNEIDYSVSYSNESAKNNYDYNYFDGVSTIQKQRENSEYYNNNFNLNLTAHTDNNSELRMQTGYTYWNRNIPGIEQGYAPGTAKQIDRDAISSLSYSGMISKTVGMQTNLDYKYSLRSYYDTSTFRLVSQINSFYKSTSFINGTSFNYKPSKKTELVLGYELSFNNISSNEIDEGSLQQGAVYAAYKLELNKTALDKISFYPSLRYDYYSNISDRNVITGKTGINIKPFKKTDLTIKSSAGNNFRAPDFNDLYWKDLGNRNLRPEKSVSIDAGVYYGINFPVKSEFELSYFYVNTTDRIVWTPGADNIWRPQNIGKVLADGINTSFKSTAELSKKLNTALFVSFNYAEATKKNEDFPGDPSTGKQMLYIPKELFKSSLMMNYLTSSKIIKFVSLNTFFTFTGRRYMNTENTIFVPAYQLLDCNVSAGLSVFKADVNLKLAINNILNEDYQVVVAYPMPLRNFKIELSFKY